MCVSVKLNKAFLTYDSYISHKRCLCMYICGRVGGWVCECVCVWVCLISVSCIAIGFLNWITLECPHKIASGTNK